MNYLIQTNKAYTKTFDQDMLLDVVIEAYKYFGITRIPCSIDMFKQDEEMNIYLEEDVAMELYGEEYENAPFIFLSTTDEQEVSFGEYCEYLEVHSGLWLDDMDLVMDHHNMSYSVNEIIINNPLMEVW